VRQEGGTKGEMKQTFLHVSIDVNKVLKFHTTQVLSVNSNTNYCIINTFSFSQSGRSTRRFYFTLQSHCCSLLNTTANILTLYNKLP
jgi:hypothetical protein